MKSYRKELWFNVPTRRSFINITSQIESCLAESGVREGLALVNAMHITASVFINDDESGLHFCFDATRRADVDAFHRASLAAGGHDNGTPGIRKEYGDDYYAAFVVDPDGYRLEAYTTSAK